MSVVRIHQCACRRHYHTLDCSGSVIRQNVRRTAGLYVKRVDRLMAIQRLSVRLQLKVRRRHRSAITDHQRQQRRRLQRQTAEVDGGDSDRQY